MPVRRLPLRHADIFDGCDFQPGQRQAFGQFFRS